MSNESITITPRQTVLRVTMNSLTAIDAKEDGIDGNGEYDPMFFAVRNRRHMQRLRADDQESRMPAILEGRRQ